MTDCQFQTFRLLHNHLLSILTTNNHEGESLAQKILQYIQFIVKSQNQIRTKELFFDYFCENQGTVIMKQVLQVQPLLGVKCLSLLFINLKDQQWVRYLLCQPCVMDAIQLQQHPHQEEWAQYYIAFLKSLSIRVTNDQISLFYNKKFCKFPIIYESMKYFNHPDCMVRANVMNIVLGFMRIKNSKVSEYFGSFPFTTYILNFCCQIGNLNQKFKSLIELPKLQTNTKTMMMFKSTVKTYTTDLTDYLCYLNDIFCYGPQKLIYFLRNSLATYALIPHLKLLNQKNVTLIKCALYQLHSLIKIIKDQIFISTLCSILMCKKISKQILYRIEKNKIYYPKVFMKQFHENTYYWDKFDYQIMELCLLKFQDVENFSTEHELKRKNNPENQQQKTQFFQEIKRISNCIGFNVLTYQQDQQFPIISVEKREQYQEINSIRSIFINLLKSQDDLVVLGTSSILILLIKSQFLSNNELKQCGVLLPKMDTVNYLDEFNIKSLLTIKQSCLHYIKNIDFKNCRTATLRNMIYLLEQSMFKQLDSEIEKEIIVKSYHQSINIMKNAIKPQQINDIVQHFQQQFNKWSKDTPNLQNQLPFSIFLKDDDTLPEVKSYYLVKNNKRQQIVRYIQSFSLLRAFYSRYVTNFQKRQIIKFSDVYNQKFKYLQQKWLIGNCYEIGFTNLLDCRTQISINPKVKPIVTKVILVQDNYNLVIVQPSSEKNQSLILVNCSWKNVQMSIHKENNSKININMKNTKGLNSLILSFQDQIRSQGALKWMKNLKRVRYEQQQAFILNFVRNCLQE